MTGPREDSGDIALMLDAIGDYAIVGSDPAGGITHWNAGAQSLFGYSEAEALGQSSATLYTEEDRATGVPEREMATAVEAGRSSFEGWRVGKGGQRFLSNAVLTPIRDEAGSVTGFAEVVRDFGAEQKRGASWFIGLMEAAPDAMLIVRSDGRIMLANAQADRMFGYRREDLVGMDAEKLVPLRTREQRAQFRAEFISDSSKVSAGASIELAVLHQDGTEIPVEVRLSSMEIEAQQLTAISIRDVTDRKEFEQRLRRQHDEIMELSTPVIQVWDKVLTLPLIGTLDSMRAARLTEGLLGRIGETQAEVIIFDISGVPTIDTAVAQHLLRTVQAAALMGTVSIMCGVRPETAQAMVHLGIDIGGLLSRGTLQEALQLALTLLAERAEATRSAGNSMGWAKFQ